MFSRGDGGRAKKYPSEKRGGAVFMSEGGGVAEAVIANLSLTGAGAVASEDALESAVREHARLVYRIAYSVLRNHHDAEDATQETFVRVLRYQRKLKGVRDRKTWLARIAWRVAVERRRKVPEIPLEEVEAEAAVAQLRSKLVSVDENVLGREMAGMLASLIAALPAQLRDVVTLSAVQELGPAEIAEVLGTSESAVRSRMFRARQVLKEKLEKRLEGKYGA
jgi:RNA polymerase sigma-70 factor (ECF subfamily)